MTRLSEYDTPTMAKIFAEQGYLRKAADIYRRLIVRYPQRKDLSLALAEVEEKLARQNGPSRKELGFLLREWRDLMLKRDQTGTRRPHNRVGGEDRDEKSKS